MNPADYAQKLQTEIKAISSFSAISSYIYLIEGNTDGDIDTLIRNYMGDKRNIVIITEVEVEDMDSIASGGYRLYECRAMIYAAFSGSAQKMNFTTDRSINTYGTPTQGISLSTMAEAITTKLKNNTFSGYLNYNGNAMSSGMPYQIEETGKYVQPIAHTGKRRE